MFGTVLFGASFYKKKRSSDEYSTGAGTIPAWVIALSIFATFVSSISFLALPGIAYLSNWNAYVYSLTVPVAIYMAIKFFIPLYRSIGSPSAYAYLEERFGLFARWYVAIFWLLTQLMRVAVILYLLALPMYVILGWDMRLIILITSISVMVYSILGGIKAVMWTDAIQSIILISGAIIAVVFLMFLLPGGSAQFFELGSRYEKFNLGSFGPSLTESTFWVVFFYGIFYNLQNFGIDQNWIQRYMSAKNEKEAKWAAFGGGLLYIPVSALFFIVGTGLFVYYYVNPGLLPHEYQQPGMSDSVFPYFIINALPAGVTGLLVASIFAAGMSTISTSLNAGATVILTDFYKRTKVQVGEKESVIVLYIASAMICIFGTFISFYIIRVESALDLWWNLAGIFSGGMLGLFLLGSFVKTVSNVPAVIGLIIGLLTIAWMSLSSIIFTGEWESIRSPFHDYLTIVFGTLIIFFTGFFISLFIPRANKFRL